MKNDITLFAKVILPKHVKKDFAPCHLELFDVLMAEAKKKVIIYPRGHGKTTIADLVFPLYCICFGLKHFIVMVSESYGQSVMNLETLKDELEFNDRVKLFFGDLRDPSKWSQDEIETLNGIKIMALGSGQKLRGRKYGSYRPDLILMDDFESEENTYTPEQRDKLKRWVDGAVVPSLSEDGEIVFIGTIVHYDSYLNSIRDHRNYLSNSKKYQQIIDDEWKIPIWPERYTVKAIKDLRDEQEEKGYIDLFYQEFMNQPISAESQLFKPEYIRYWEGDIKIDDGGVWLQHPKDFDGERKSEYLATFIGVDPALGKVKGDFTVLMVIGMNHQGKVYVLEYTRKRIGVTDTIEEMFRLYAKYKPRTISIEANAWQETVAQNTMDEMMRRKTWFAINEVKPRKGKTEKFQDRNNGLEPRFRRHYVLLAKDQQDLYQELISYPKARYDDCIDSLYNAIDGAYPPDDKVFKPEGDYHVFQPDYYNWRVL